MEELAYYLDEDELRHFKGLHDGAVGMEFGFAVAAVWPIHSCTFILLNPFLSNVFVANTTVTLTL